MTPYKPRQAGAVKPKLNPEILKLGLVSFLTDLSNWYVRLNRRRLKGMPVDDAAADFTLEAALVLGACCGL